MLNSMDPQQDPGAGRAGMERRYLGLQLDEGDSTPFFKNGE